MEAARSSSADVILRAGLLEHDRRVVLEQRDFVGRIVDPDGRELARQQPEVKAAVAACKSRIASAPNISADAKSKLTSLCDKAASGDQAGVLKAAAQVCQEIVKQSVPQAAQQQALASCPKA